MSLTYSPKIILDGLVLCLDPNQNKSLPASSLPVKDGLIMWMDAADDSTFSYSSGTTVSQWRDKSGSNYHMTPVSAGPTRNAFLNSRKILAFTNTQDIQNLSIDLRTSAYSIFVVSRYTNAASGTGRILTSNSSYNNWLLGHWASEVNKYYANGWVYSTYAAIDTNWKLYLGDWGGPSNDLANFYGAGTAIATNSADASAGPWTLGISAYSGEKSNCEVAEIIVFNRLLTTTERKLIHTYLGLKWGISNTDRSIIDLSGNDYNGLFGNGTTANMPDYDFYNKGALAFNGSSDEVNFGDVLKFTTSQNFTLEVWVNYIPNSTSYVPLLSKEDASTGFGYALKVDETYSYNPYLVLTGPSAYRYANININDGLWHHIVGVAKSSSATIDMYVDGVLRNGISNLTSWTGTPTSNALRLGKNVGSAFFKGKLSNAKIYNRALSAAEIAQNYETQKSKFTNTIIQQGLVLNLDASNPYSYSGAGSTWYDVSGAGYNATAVNSPTITSDSIKYFTLSSTQNFTISNPISSQGKLTQVWTVSAWVNVDVVTGAGARYLISGLNEGLSVDFYDSGTLLYLAGGADDYYTYGNAVEGTGWIFLTFLFRNSDGYRKIYSNLVDITTSGPNNTSTPSGNSATFTIGNNMRGKIAHIMMYNRLLSIAEVTQNYNATKARFGF